MNELDKHAASYKPNSELELENNLILNWYPQRILRRLNGNTAKSLLELGLGHGYTTLLFNDFFESHVIIDGSEEIIKQFKTRYAPKKFNIVAEYFENFETNELFDVIVMGFVLEHVDDPDLIVRKFKKFLKPRGKIYIAVPNAKSLNRRMGLELGIINDIYSLNENDLKLGHKRQFCVDSLSQLVEREGYKINLIEGIYLKPLPLGELKKINNFEANLQAMLKVGIDFPEICVAMLMEIEVA